MTVVEDSKIETVLRSIMNQRALNISYVKSNGELSNRVIIPLDFVRSKTTEEWRVFGFCSLRNEFRSFRHDRINKIDLVNTSNQYKLLKKDDQTNMFVILRKDENSSPTSVIRAIYNGTNISGNLINSGVDRPATVLTIAEAERVFNDLLADGFKD